MLLFLFVPLWALRLSSPCCPPSWSCSSWGPAFRLGGRQAEAAPERACESVLTCADPPHPHLSLGPLARQWGAQPLSLRLRGSCGSPAPRPLPSARGAFSPHSGLPDQLALPGLRAPGSTSASGSPEYSAYLQNESLRWQILVLSPIAFVLLFEALPGHQSGAEAGAPESPLESGCVHLFIC